MSLIEVVEPEVVRDPVSQPDSSSVVEGEWEVDKGSI
jgi:hypothetical protein